MKTDLPTDGHITHAHQKPQNSDIDLNRRHSIGLMKTFLYFAVFKHPLTREEAQVFCQSATTSIDDELQYLLDKGLLFKIGDYYLPKNDAQWVERRIAGNQMAARKMKKARKMAKILNHFPFVRSVMISGSLSKGYMDSQSDIDFFVIMKPGNIASSKIMMGTFRRLFARKSFCINFMIDSDNLAIKKRTIYSAVEMATLIPMINLELYNRFMKTNLDWVSQYLPNYTFEEQQGSVAKRPIIKIFAEFLLSLKLANSLNNTVTRFYYRLHRSLNQEYKKNIETGELVIEKGVLKFHNSSYEQRILNMYHSYQEGLVLNNEFVINEHFSE